MRAAGRRTGTDIQQLQEVGTIAGVAAMTKLLQQSAIANMAALDALLRWARQPKLELTGTVRQLPMLALNHCFRK